jgi:hypothetical protein
VISKYFPEGSNVTNNFDDRSGADDSILPAGDTIVAFSYVTSSDVNPPMITISTLLNDNTTPPESRLIASLK